MGRPATNKRQRLVAAAAARFHQAGVARTSLGDIARSAGVPAGNVFYYFKTKDDLAKAVVDDWCDGLAGHLAELETVPDPIERIQAFIAQTAGMLDWYVEWGCPFAGLARDLRQGGGPLADDAPRPYIVQIEWLQLQFRQAGFPAQDAVRQARFVLSVIHGSILLAHSTADQTFLDDGLKQLRNWVSTLREHASVSGHQ